MRENVLKLKSRILVISEITDQRAPREPTLGGKSPADIKIPQTAHTKGGLIEWGPLGLKFHVT